MAYMEHFYRKVDFKHAMRLVRLLRMGKEALFEGKLCAKRSDCSKIIRCL